MSNYNRNTAKGVAASNYNFSESRGTDPQLMKRSIFQRNSTLATGFQVGDIVPLYVEEILPNDTVSMDCNFALRMQTLACVPYDNLEMDIYWFYCPNRLLWDGWKQFCGASQSAWLDKTPLRVPELRMNGFENQDAALGTVWDYMGLPILTKDMMLNGKQQLGINALPFRMYGKIWNDWFRDVNYDAELLIDYSNQDVTWSATDPVKGGKLLKANKKHDYFSSCLPQPQRADDINLMDGLRYLELNVSPSDSPNALFLGGGLNSVRWVDKTGDDIGNIGSAYRTGMLVTDFDNKQRKDTGRLIALPTDVAGDLTNAKEMIPSNLVVDISGDNKNANPGFLDSFTIANLRKSIAKQQIAEVSARCGNRYENFLLGFFGVEGPDIETGRSELLGVQHTILNIAEVVQTSGTADNSTPQGNIAGRSLTNAKDPHAFSKSFLEHGWLMAVGVARYNHSYSQGIRRQWMRKTLDDYYTPQYANIGDVPVYDYEIYADSSTIMTTTDAFGTGRYPIWGYQEYGAEYKYVPNQITGAIRPNIDGGLAPWTWSDNYETVPTMSPEWLKEDPNNVSRSLAIEPTMKVPQIFGNFYFENQHTRMMPVHSIPGLDRI